MANGRDARGRWLPGVSGGGKSPGRPPREKEETYLAAMREIITPEGWKEACRVALSRMMAGDQRYFKVVAEYLQEKAATRLDIAERHFEVSMDIVRRMEELGIDPDDVMIEAERILRGASVGTKIQLAWPEEDEEKEIEEAEHEDED